MTGTITLASILSALVALITQIFTLKKTKIENEQKKWEHENSIETKINDKKSEIKEATEKGDVGDLFEKAKEFGKLNK